MERVDDERTWQWYLAYLANPRTEILSFNEFKDEFLNKSPAQKVQQATKRSAGMTKQQLNKQVSEAQRQLKLLPSPEKMKKEGGNSHG